MSWRCRMLLRSSRLSRRQLCWRWLTGEVVTLCVASQLTAWSCSLLATTALILTSMMPTRWSAGELSRSPVFAHCMASATTSGASLYVDTTPVSMSVTKATSSDASQCAARGRDRRSLGRCHLRRPRTASGRYQARRRACQSPWTIQCWWPLLASVNSRSSPGSTWLRTAGEGQAAILNSTDELQWIVSHFRVFFVVVWGDMTLTTSATVSSTR